MAEFIHRNGSWYRLWYSIPDRYGTPPMTRAEMREHLVEHGAGDREAEARLSRADATGTSAVHGARRADCWDTERCRVCEDFHHAFEAREGEPDVCRACGEAEGDGAHGPACETEGE